MLLGLYFTWQETVLTRDQFGQSIDLTRHQLEISERSQVSARFSGAVERLSDDRVSIRLGGIYSLGQIARDSARDLQAVTSILAAFVRESATQDAYRETVDLGQLWPVEDIAGALSVLSEINATEDFDSGYRINLRGVSLQDGRLMGINLRGANLNYTNLENAILAKSQLGGALLSGANLSFAHLEDVDLQEASLSAADLRDAKLSNSDLSRSLLESSNMSNAFLFRAKLNYALLNGATLINANLREAELRGASFVEANLDQAHLQGADLREASSLTQEQINSTCVDESTKLPEHLRRPAECAEDSPDQVDHVRNEAAL